MRKRHFAVVRKFAYYFTPTPPHGLWYVQTHGVSGSYLRPDLSVVGEGNCHFYRTRREAREVARRAKRLVAEAQNSV